jgi:hypothetical protein
VRYRLLGPLQVVRIESATDERLREESTGTDERLREESTGTDERLREESTGTEVQVDIGPPKQRGAGRPAAGAPSRGLRRRPDRRAVAWSPSTA